MYHILSLFIMDVVHTTLSWTVIVNQASQVITQVFPNLLNLFQINLTIQISSATCER